MDIIGKKGGGGEPYVPKEDENSLRSNSVARIVDIISEGEIVGLVDGDKSIYIDEIQLRSDGGDYNFEGITTAIRTGLPNQDYIPGFTDSAQAEQAVGTEMLYNVPLTKSITNTNIDEVVVTIRIPSLLVQKDNGDLLITSVRFKIEINNNGGSYVLVNNYTVTGKCISEYLKSYRLPPLSNYGSGPWNIKLTRTTDDADSVKLSNKTFWNTYTEHINEKIRYVDTALIAFRADSQQFGGKIPQRLYHIKGLKIKHPSNYNPETLVYTGVWDGTFTIGYTNNPAWVYYDLLYTDRYGCGFEKDIGTGDYFIDKWELYTISKNCDVLVDDGCGSEERRYTFNTVINTREQAFKTLLTLASVFRAKPFWSTGMSTLSQDRLKDPVKVVCNADVVDGMFSYSGTSIKDKVTCVNVSWNDPEDLYKPAIEMVEDKDGIDRYGWNSYDIFAYGCTSRGQAQRYGKWYLYTELNQGETVDYTASFDHFHLIPGDVIIVNDDHYITKKLGGRIESATTSQITLDRKVTLESGKTYTIAMESPTGLLVRADILNSSSETNILSISTILSDEVPQPWSVFSINSDSFDERQFQIVSMNVPEHNVINITAVLYDPNKYSEVDTGVYFDDKHYSDINTGDLLPPTNVTSQEYTYEDGQNNLFGVLFGWTHADDSRVNRYESQYKVVDGLWINLPQTEQASLDLSPVIGGDYQYRVRSKSISGFSVWVIIDFTIAADPDPLTDVTDIQIVGGGIIFNGRDCEIEWTYAKEARFQTFFIEVYLIDDTLLRTYQTIESSYIYTYMMNEEDNSGVPCRSLKFRVYVRDVYDKLSSGLSLAVSNPIPTMAGTTPTVTDIFKGLKIDWLNITPDDNDLEKYKVYIDTSNPPTTEVAEVGYGTTSWIEVDLSTEDAYFCQIEPYDCFGIGTKSAVGSGDPLKLQEIDVGFELANSIDMSDSDSNTTETLSKLYDGNKVSDGIEYVLSGTDKYIEFKFPVEYIIDNVTAWFANTAANIYIAYKRDTGTWKYLKAEADHTLDTNGRLLTATDQSDAQTNYLDTTSGINKSLFPEAVVATQCRLYFIGTYTATIYELRFIREVIAEQIVADRLSAISADIGVVSAGLIQSSDYDSSHGFLADLTGNGLIKVGGNTLPKIDWDGSQLKIRAAVTFEGNSTGYDNIDDKPSNLGDINSTEGSKLTGIASGADVTGSNTSYDTARVNSLSASTLISGGYIGTNLVKANSIYANSVTAVKINAAAVTAVKIGANAVTSDKIYANAVTAAKIGAGIITSSHIGTNEIVANSANIKNAIIQTAKIASHQVTKAWGTYGTSLIEAISNNWVTVLTLSITPSANSGSGSEYLISGASSIGMYKLSSNPGYVGLRVSSSAGSPSLIESKSSLTSVSSTSYPSHGSLSVVFKLTTSNDSSFILYLQFRSESVVDKDVKCQHRGLYAIQRLR